MPDLERVEILEMPETHVLVVEPQNAVEGLQKALAAQNVAVSETRAVGDLRVPAGSSTRVHEIIRSMNVIPRVTQVKSPKEITTPSV